MQGKIPAQQAATQAVVNALAAVGPSIVKVKPLRKVISRVVEHELLKSRRNASGKSPYPPGVRDDRAVMALAMLRTVERLIEDGNIAPAVWRNGARYLAKDILILRGKVRRAEQFRSQYGLLPPGFLTIAPGKGCNLQCIGCYADSGPTPERLEWSIVDRIVTETKELWGKHSFVVTGGEPLAYKSEGKGLLELAEMHQDCFFMFYTNGTLISDKVAQRMARIGNLSPAISVEGWRERTDARRGQGVYDKVLAAMQRLRAAGVPFGVSLTATRYNAEEILSDEFLDFFFRTQGALYGWVFHYMPIGRSYTLDLMPTPKQRLWMWRRTWEVIRQRQIFLADFWNHGTTCNGCLAGGRYTGGGYMYIDWNGAVCPCVFVPYSPVNIRDVYAQGGTLNDAWADPFFADIRTWQANYAAGNGHAGNWMAPCIIRDHQDDFRVMLAKHEPEPTDPNAAEALMDSEYARAMIAYGHDYQALSGQVWDQLYLRPEEPSPNGLPPLPEIAPDPAPEGQAS